ncbi:MAG: Uma2 family endonuclease [Bryobacter sp.]|nr:Uma2 family endonuclease [Bryobacter sp.]
MASISAKDYLRTAYPGLDCEFRDGSVEQRSDPDNLHSRTQAFFVAFFFALRRTMRLFPRPELRLKLRKGLYLIPDVAVFREKEPQESIPASPPYVAIEILSPDDSMTAVRRKLADYWGWGVPYVWLVDPYSKRLYTCEGELREVARLELEDLSLVLEASEIFDEVE